MGTKFGKQKTELDFEISGRMIAYERRQRVRIAKIFFAKNYSVNKEKKKLERKKYGS